MKTTCGVIFITSITALLHGCSGDSAREDRVELEPAEALMSVGQSHIPLTAGEIRALERDPGATPPLQLEREQPSYLAPSLDGSPGPSPAAGPKDASVQVYVFTDFQCPVCSRVVEPLKELVRSDSDVRVIFKHNALETHTRAIPAAVASIAAFRQGKFSEFFDATFAQRGVHDQYLIDRAAELGLDLEQFKLDLKDPTAAAQVRYETALAEASGATSTPAFFVNGKLMMGWASYGVLKRSIETARSQAVSIASEGTSREELAGVATRQAGENGTVLANLLWGPDSIP